MSIGKGRVRGSLVGSAAMEGYFEDGDGWEENALIRVL